MKRKTKVAFFIVMILSLLAMAAFVIFIPYMQNSTIAVLEPKGLIAKKQMQLLVKVSYWMLIVVVPVMIISFYVAWKYRSSNVKAKYEPDWDNSHLAESIWWSVPTAIIVVLSIMTWTSSHELDPTEPIMSTNPTMKVQVIALQWKWLFIYPEQGIATVNYLQIPEKTPVKFEISADAPMNSFWIPQLGGQIYAMPGMRSQLHLIADQKGTYRGASANLSGKGFAGMTFTVKATSLDEFNQWVDDVKTGEKTLTKGEYEELVKPSSYQPVSTYSSVDGDLFEMVVMQYMRQSLNNKMEMPNK